MFGSPDGPPPPNTISHKPGFTSTLFEESVSWPRNFPVVSNALMVPSPKLPTRMAFGNAPNVAGVATTPHGALSMPPAAKVFTKLPFMSKMSTCPRPAPGVAVVLSSVLHRIGDEDLVTDDVDAVGSETRGKCRIGERAAQRSGVEVMIEDIDFAAVEVRCQKAGAVEQGETFVNRATGGVIEGHCRCVAGAGPVSDDAIFGVKNKLSAAERQSRYRLPRFP